MTTELFSDEYRNFKYLKSSPEVVEYLKHVSKDINNIQPWGNYYPDFRWPNRVEFIEQVFDLRNQSMHIVSPGSINSNYLYEEANLLDINHPTILTGNPLLHAGWRYATVEDIPHMEINPQGTYCIIEASTCPHAPDGFGYDSRVIRLNALPFSPNNFSTVYTAIFSERMTAEKYRDALTVTLRKKTEAMSSFSRRL